MNWYVGVTVPTEGTEGTKEKAVPVPTAPTPATQF